MAHTMIVGRGCRQWQEPEARAVYTQAREGRRRGGETRREKGGRGQRSGRAEGQAEMKAERERKHPILRICLKSILT